MPRVSITEENRAGTTVDRFAKLMLKTGEKARFIAFSDDFVWQEWVHDLKAPVMENGVAAMEDRKNKDNSVSPVHKMQFLRRSICLGTEGALADKGSDPENCPACRGARDGDVAAAVQRFAIAVVRYNLAGASWQVMQPFGASVLIWPVTAKKWNELIKITNKVGDLKKIDLTLDCEDGTWQRTELDWEESAWPKIPNAGAYIHELLSSPANLPTEPQLQDACGSPTTRNYMQQDVDTIMARWREVRRSGPAGGGMLPSTAPVDLGAGLDGLLGTPPAKDEGMFQSSWVAPAADPFAAAAHAAPAQAPAPAVDPFAAATVPAASAPAGNPFAGAMAPADPFTAAVMPAVVQEAQAQAAQTVATMQLAGYQGPAYEPPAPAPVDQLGQPNPFAAAAAAQAAPAPAPAQAAPAPAQPAPAAPVSFADIFNIQ